MRSDAKVPAVCFLIVLSALGAHAADWPMLGRDSTRNAVSPEKGPPLDWDVGTQDENTGKWQGGRNIRWRAKLASTTFGDPVIASGQIWIGTNNATLDDQPPLDAGVLMGFNIGDGKPLYKYLAPRLASGRVHDWPYAALANAPLIEGDRMWFTSNRAETVCLDLAPLKQGKGEPHVVWKVDLIKQFGVSPCGSRMIWTHTSSVAAYKDLIFVITGNGVDENWQKVPAPQAPSLICFNKNTGEVVWQDKSPGENILAGQWASPLVIEVEGAAQVIAPQGDGWLRSFEAQSGKLIWKFDINPKTSVYRLGRSTRNILMAAPVFYDGRIYIAGGQYVEHSGDGPARLVCIDPTKHGDISSELAVDAENKPLPHRRYLAVDTTKGEKALPNPNSGLVWEYQNADRDSNGKIEFEEMFHRTSASVAIKDGLLIAGDSMGLIHCLDAKTGKVHWTYDNLAIIHAPPLIVEDKVFIGDEDGTLTVLRLSATPPQAPLYESSFGGSIYTAPIFSDGVLYVASQQWLFAIAPDPKPASDSAVQHVTRTPPEARLLPPSKGDATGAATARERTPRSVFVPTPRDVVERMLSLADVKKTDVVVDLGSGDGRIVIMAAKEHGCRAIGYELDRDLVASSREHAKKQGVGQLATFHAKDLFTANLEDATVVTLYLLPNQLERLAGQFEKLKPGTRIVSHHFALPGWEPAESITMNSKEDGEKHAVYLWRTPLRRAAEKK